MNVAGVARARWIVARRAFTRGGGGAPGRRRQAPAAVALTLAFAAFVFYGLFGLFGWLADLETPAEAAGVMLGFVFATAIAALLVFDLHEAVVALVADSDLELLRRAPLSPRAILALKVTDALPRTGIVLVTLALPAACAYAAVYRLGAWGWAALAPVLAALWLLALGLGTGLAIDLLRVVPARRARELLALLSTLTLTLLWLANAFLLPRIEDPAGTLAARLGGTLAHPPALVAFSPPHWAAGVLAAAAAGRGAVAARHGLALFAAAALAVAFASWRAGAGLETVQTRIASPAGRRRARARTGARAARERPRGVLAAVVARDARLFARDWTVLGDVLTAAALWTLLPLVLAPLGGLPPVTVARAMLLGLTVGLGYEVAARSLPFEREGLAWIALAPVSAARWVGAKFAAVSVISLPLLAVACGAIALALRLSTAEWIGTLCLVLPALGLAQLLGLLTGAVFGDPHWTHPRATLTLPGRLLASVGLVGQAAFWLGLSELLRVPALGLPAGLAPAAPAVIAALLAVLPLRLLLQRVAGLEWSS